MVECRRRGIIVTNVGDLFSDDVADAAVGLLIDVVRRISCGDKFVRGGWWTVTEQFHLGSKVSSVLHNTIFIILYFIDMIFRFHLR